MYSQVGVPKLMLPYRRDEITREIILSSLKELMPRFAARKAKISKLYDTYMTQHDIRNKTRLYEDQMRINNIIVEPHLYNIINFKKGFIYGHAKQFAQKNVTGKKEIDEDTGYLGKYIEDVTLATTDTNVAEWVYATGVGYYFIRPRTGDYDINEEAPFDIFPVESTRAFKVYSSYIDEAELFDVVVSYLGDETHKPPDVTDGNEKLIEKYALSVYTGDTVYNFTSYGFGADIEYKKKDEIIKWDGLPLVEKYSNSRRFGIVELGRSLQNAIDNITSTSIDNIDEFVEQIFVFLNTEATEDEVRKMRQNGMIILKSNNPAIAADIKTLINALNHKDVNIIYERLVKTLYDVCGCPQASGQVTSGGDTGQARNLGGGWEFAYISAINDTKNHALADKKLLRKILDICKITPNCPLKDIKASNIEVKYNISRSDNLLIKTQSLQNLVAMKYPLQAALEAVELTSDPYATAELWKIEIESANEEARANGRSADEPIKTATEVVVGEKGG